ncbi:hypothetical protein B0T25DRAFT_542728 [Lasiosphaeria hispida]|uniref:Uncharacterized protein n=1 Tax=Lasiosphaeria hispida TaxID=260671 RepID=A0AAJ0MDS3_9PEZI|nr:hypothetical protein B0T25DRAFT_542728 [Lasiosphaeria hispida]
MDNLPREKVTLRIEGRTKTIFEGEVSSNGCYVKTNKGGIHRCDGSGHEKPSTLGNTPTATLAHASPGNFSFDGKYFHEFKDFLIDEIEGEKGNWLVYVNEEPIQVGGGQHVTKERDRILWAWAGPFDPLVLDGPSTAQVNRQVTFKVRNGKTREPVGDVDVNGSKTNQSGEVIITFQTDGMKKLKANKELYIRSNTHSITISN